jgi:hypothetical protein
MDDTAVSLSTSLDGHPPLAPVEVHEENIDTGNKIARWIVWSGLMLLFGGFVLLFKVNTYLGVKVRPTFVSIGGIVSEQYDKRGQDYVWNVWWRARDEMLSLGPSWRFTVLMLILVALFVLGSAMVIWIAMVPDEPGAVEPSDELVIAPSR